MNEVILCDRCGNEVFESCYPADGEAYCWECIDVLTKIEQDEHQKPMYQGLKGLK